MAIALATPVLLLLYPFIKMFRENIYSKFLASITAHGFPLYGLKVRIGNIINIGLNIIPNLKVRSRE